jgi:hypothetical protein
MWMLRQLCTPCVHFSAWSWSTSYYVPPPPPPVRFARLCPHIKQESRFVYLSGNSIRPLMHARWLFSWSKRKDKVEILFGHTEHPLVLCDQKYPSHYLYMRLQLRLFHFCNVSRTSRHFLQSKYTAVASKLSTKAKRQLDNTTAGTAWNRVIFENMIVAHPVRRFPDFAWNPKIHYYAQCFSTWARWIQYDVYIVVLQDPF